MAAENFDLQGWMREQKQGPFNQKALQESIGGYVDFTNYNSLSEAEEEEEDMMDMKDDWYEKPEVDNTPDEDAIDRKATMKAMAMKKSKKADKSIEDLNKDFNKMLNFSDEEDDMYDPFYEGMGMSPEALDRMEGVVNTKHLQAFKQLFSKDLQQIFKSLVGDWMNDGFDQEDIINYISGMGGFSTSQPFMNQSDDLEDDLSNDVAYGTAFDSMDDDLY